MTRPHSSHIALYVTTTAALILVACGGSAAETTAGAGVQAGTAGKVVIPGGDRFAPFALTVSPGTTVTFRNSDSDAHSVVSVPGAPASLSKTLASGSSWSVTLTSSGLYRYYCSIHARYDPATQQVEGLPSADHPSQPMEGVIVVQ